MIYDKLKEMEKREPIKFKDKVIGYVTIESNDLKLPNVIAISLPDHQHKFLKSKKSPSAYIKKLLDKENLEEGG